jgi:hypothetical protein
VLCRLLFGHRGPHSLIARAMRLPPFWSAGMMVRSVVGAASKAPQSFFVELDRAVGVGGSKVRRFRYGCPLLSAVRQPPTASTAISR